MESSTKQNEDQVTQLVSGAWEQVGEKLGLDLEESARRQKALVRRRGIQSAQDLLRLVLVYCLKDWSLQVVGAWALMQKVGELSDVAVLKRLRNSHNWLGEVLYTCLSKRCHRMANLSGIQVRIQDATVINAPGSQGTQWRMHLKLDLKQGCISGVEVTDAHGGETLARLPIEAGEIQVADRGYAFARGIGAVLAQFAHIVVRINWQSLSLSTATGKRFDLIGWLRLLTTSAEQSVWIETPQGHFALRVIAQPLPPQAAEEARRRAHQAAQKKKHTIREETLLAAGFLLLITDLPQQCWSIQRILWLYRLRWQIELQFKTFKSLLRFDELRSKDPRFVQTYLFGKLLGVVLLEQLTQQVHLRQPDWFADPDRPVSSWRLTAFQVDLLRQFFTGYISFDRFWACLPALQRYFRCRPRARINQLAWGQAVLEHLSCNFSFFGC
jgi:hypothetical protein